MKKIHEKLENTVLKLTKQTHELKSQLTIYMLQIEDEGLDKPEEACLEHLGEIVNKKLDELLFAERLILKALDDLRGRRKLNIENDNNPLIL